MVKYNKNLLKSAWTLFNLTSEKIAAETLNVTTETLNRYVREFQRLYPQETDEKFKSIKQISEKYTDEQLVELSKGKFLPNIKRSKLDKYENLNYIKIGVISDTHFGSKYFDEGWYDTALDKFEKQNVNFIVHCGDVVEGTINKMNQILDLTHIGYEQQYDYAVKQLSKIKKDLFIISGNHDLWFRNSIGADICKGLGETLDNVIYLGQHEGLIQISNIKIDLWHGNDGSSYALSYRPQKIVESLYGGEKPNLLIAGHDHKAGYFFIRNVHFIQAGTLQHQTEFMRTKTRSQAHTGFWMLGLGYDKKGIKELNQTFYPFYE